MFWHLWQQWTSNRPPCHKFHLWVKDEQGSWKQGYSRCLSYFRFLHGISSECSCYELFVLRFYGPVNPMGSCQAWSVYLTTRLLGRLSPLSGLPVLCTFFRQKLTTALLESAEGREWPQKIFHDQSPRKNVADLGGGWTRDLLVSSRTAHPNEPPRPAILAMKCLRLSDK